jgi:hypothetical protein
MNNRSKLNDHLLNSFGWNNDAGDDGFNSDDAFDMAEGGEQTVSGTGVVRGRKPTSMPYVFTVTSSDAATQTVVLFGSEVNRTAAYFGNPATIAISYDLLGYFGGSSNGYAALLARTESQPLVFGRYRMSTSSSAQLAVPLNITDSDPTGKSVTYPVVNYTKLNQYITTAIESECDITIYGGTQLSYSHLAGVSVTWFFWAADVASLTRALEGKGAFKELKRPDTYLNQTVKFQGLNAG